ncbi:AcrR family transcriptional regulator [Mycolicibacterium iranicum]|uniref:AcrR family transcriptional regulator n=1 Tax=Mycolicibacterium iranicum TaxID=912594 RepID=A0A839QCL0_MYCIR|nr:TetR/AcrR family transcriptional regulator [Mycolicibacterium iranicum]MBB2990992.1 AcrR family transcriptional regulator [Mycolicibacterium iranicum]
MAEAKLGRPRDVQLHHAILETTRRMLTEHSYAALSMESVAARARVGKKTLYRRWSSKAPLVAEAVLDAYGRDGSFPVPDTGDIRRDLGQWLAEHSAFIAESTNAALIRALVAASAANPTDNEALYAQLTAPQRDGLVTRLRKGVASGELRTDADVDAVTDAVIGYLLVHLLAQPALGGSRTLRMDGLLTALLVGIGND